MESNLLNLFRNRITREFFYLIATMTNNLNIYNNILTLSYTLIYFNTDDGINL